MKDLPSRDSKEFTHRVAVARKERLEKERLAALIPFTDFPEQDWNIPCNQTPFFEWLDKRGRQRNECHIDAITEYLESYGFVLHHHKIDEKEFRGFELIYNFYARREYRGEVIR